MRELMYTDVTGATAAFLDFSDSTGGRETACPISENHDIQSVTVLPGTITSQMTPCFDTNRL